MLCIVWFSLWNSVIGLHCFHGGPTLLLHVFVTGCFRCCASAGYNIVLHFRGDEQFAWHLECCKWAEPAGLWRCVGSNLDPPNTAGKLQQPAANTQSPGELTFTSLDVDIKELFDTRGFNCVFAYRSGLLSTFSGGCWYEQESSTNVHFSSQQYSVSHCVSQHLRELNRWRHLEKNNLFFCLSDLNTFH